MEIARNWRLQKTRYGTARGGLVGERCPDGHFIFPPRDLCPECAADRKNPSPAPHEFSGKGEIYSYTTIYNPEDAPTGFEGQTPYTIALVRLIEENAEGQRIEGPLVTAMLTDLDLDLQTGKRIDLPIGAPVEMVTRKLRQDGDRGIIIYGYKFRPALQPMSRQNLRKS